MHFFLLGKFARFSNRKTSTFSELTFLTTLRQERIGRFVSFHPRRRYISVTVQCGGGSSWRPRVLGDRRRCHIKNWSICWKCYKLLSLQTIFLYQIVFTRCRCYSICRRRGKSWKTDYRWWWWCRTKLREWLLFYFVDWRFWRLCIENGTSDWLRHCGIGERICDWSRIARLICKDSLTCSTI